MRAASHIPIAVAGLAVLVVATLVPHPAGNGEGARAALLPLAKALSSAEAAASVTLSASVGPVAATPIMPVALPLKAIDALVAPSLASGAPQSAQARQTALALLYAPSDVSQPLQPDALQPLPDSGVSPEPLPGAADQGPTEVPVPVSITPADMLAAKLAIDAYRQGDMTQGDAAAASVDSEVGRVALQWAAIKLDPRGLSFGRIMAFLKAHPDWPSARWLRDRAEEALYADREDFALLAAYFAKTAPETGLGKLALARLLRQQGQEPQAAALVRAVWREDDFSISLEPKIVGEFGDLLTGADHKFRADRAFYEEEAGRLMRAAALAGGDEVALAKAQAAVIGGARDAATQLAGVPQALKSDPSYIFAQAQLLRRADKPDKLVEAAKLLLSAPRDAETLVDGDAWWIERRIVARKLLDAGDAATAYQLCAQAMANSPRLRIEAQFHAGWIALRFLDDASRAAPHFAVAAGIATTPASIARAAYWQGRSAEALGDDAAANVAYKLAAEQATTYYGQLAGAKLGLDDLPLRETRGYAVGDERDIAVKVAEFLYATGESELALPVVVGGAKYIDDLDQLVALGKVVEASGDAKATLVLGKLAVQRGLPLDDLAFPTFGIPRYEPVANSADKPVVYAIARQESAFAQTATSRAGAQGLMQLMPATARIAAKRAGIPLDMARLNSDGALNARIGAAHLGDLLAEQRNSYILTFAAYNAGGKRVKEWIAAHGDPRKGDVDPVDWVERIPITETREYVQHVIENMQVYRARFGQNHKLINEAELRQASGG